MAGNGYYSGAADIEHIQRGVNGIMAVMKFTNDAAIYSKLCFVDNGATTNGTPIGREIAGVNNGNDGQAGDVIHYPLSPVSNAPRKWPMGVPAEETDLVVVDVAVRRTQTAVPIERIYLNKQDPYQILAGKQAAVASRMLRAPDFDLADLINRNAAPENYFDGLSYFHTAHPVKPGAQVTFSNDITCTVPEWDSGDGMAKLLSALRRIPWFDGKLKDGLMTKPLIVTADTEKELKARQLVGMVTGLVGPALVGTASGGAQTSFLQGMVSDVVNFQDLYDPLNFADSGKYVYAIACAGGQCQPAFIMSPKQWPIFRVYGLADTEEIRRVHNAIGWRWDGFWGVGHGLPQCAVRMKIG